MYYNKGYHEFNEINLPAHIFISDYYTLCYHSDYILICIRLLANVAKMSILPLLKKG